MEEAKDHTVDLILSYHPPIFVPLKRLTQRNWKERIVVECMENRIAVFSPHTSHDAVEGGVNDWLISAFGVWAKKSLENGYMKIFRITPPPSFEWNCLVPFSLVMVMLSLNL